MCMLKCRKKVKLSANVHVEVQEKKCVKLRANVHVEVQEKK